jgi:hypothetical protein
LLNSKQAAPVRGPRARLVLGLGRALRAARAERQLAEAQALLAARAAGQHRARQHRVLRRQQQHLRAQRRRSLARARLRATRGGRAAGAAVPAMQCRAAALQQAPSSWRL